MKWLFDTKDFVPRMKCGDWEIWLIVLYITANWIIALAYYAIPIGLFYYWKKRKLAIEKHWIILLFVAFIFLCGTTHLLDGLTFWWPAYRFLTLVDLATASVSLVTAILLIPVIRFKLHYKTPKEYEELQEQLQKQLGEEREMVLKIRDINHDLANRAQYFQNIIATQGWISANQLKLSELRNIITNLREQYKPKLEQQEQE